MTRLISMRNRTLPVPHLPLRPCTSSDQPSTNSKSDSRLKYTQYLVIAAEFAVQDYQVTLAAAANRARHVQGGAVGGSARKDEASRQGHARGE